MSDTSPYTPPSAAVADAAVEFGEISIFSINGRLGRLRYLTYGFAVALIGQLLFGLMGSMGSVMQNEAGGAITMIGIAVVSIAIIVVSVMLAVQRLHDLDKTGWFYLLFLVPFLNIFFGLYVLFASGTQGANRYGNPPPPNSTGVKIAAWFLIVVVFIGGILAAIAIPAYNNYIQKSQEIQLQQQ